MWALRRASLSLMNQGFSIGTSRACCASSELPAYIQEYPCFLKSCESISDGCLSSKRLHYATHVPSYFAVERRSLSSQAGAKSSGEEDELEDGFSELETAPSAEGIEESVTRDENEDELVSDPEYSEDDEEVEPSQHGLELSGTDPSENIVPRKRDISALFKAILACPGLSVHGALDKWVEEGNVLDRAEIALAMLNLRKRKMYGRALQFSEWLEERKEIEFVERDYASRVDLIAKVRGLEKAEKFIETIPKSLRGEVIYRTLLANFVAANNVKKSEEVFNKMKGLEFPVTSFTCNQLLLLYKRIDKKKIADVLLLMVKENVKPTPFTCRLLIDMKGQLNV